MEKRRIKKGENNEGAWSAEGGGGVRLREVTVREETGERERREERTGALSSLHFLCCEENDRSLRCLSVFHFLSISLELCEREHKKKKKRRK